MEDKRRIDFSAVFYWIVRNTRDRVSFSSDVDLFEKIFEKYIRDECVVYSPGRISQFKSGRSYLPRQMVSRYWMDDDYQNDLWIEIESLLVMDMTDTEKALAELVQLIQEDNTISDTQRNMLLHCTCKEQCDRQTEFVVNVLLYAMRVRGDPGCKSA